MPEHNLQKSHSDNSLPQIDTVSQGISSLLSTLITPKDERIRELESSVEDLKGKVSDLENLLQASNNKITELLDSRASLQKTNDNLLLENGTIRLNLETTQDQLKKYQRISKNDTSSQTDSISFSNAFSQTRFEPPAAAKFTAPSTETSSTELPKYDAPSITQVSDNLTESQSEKPLEIVEEVSLPSTPTKKPVNLDEIPIRPERVSSSLVARKFSKPLLDLLNPQLSTEVNVSEPSTDIHMIDPAPATPELENIIEIQAPVSPQTPPKPNLKADFQEKIQPELPKLITEKPHASATCPLTSLLEKSRGTENEKVTKKDEETPSVISELPSFTDPVSLTSETSSLKFISDHSKIRIKTKESSRDPRLANSTSVSQNTESEVTVCSTPAKDATSLSKIKERPKSILKAPKVPKPTYCISEVLEKSTPLSEPTNTTQTHSSTPKSPQKFKLDKNLLIPALQKYVEILEANIKKDNFKTEPFKIKCLEILKPEHHTLKFASHKRKFDDISSTTTLTKQKNLSHDTGLADSESSNAIEKKKKKKDKEKDKEKDRIKDDPKTKDKPKKSLSYSQQEQILDQPESSSKTSSFSHSEHFSAPKNTSHAEDPPDDPKKFSGQAQKNLKTLEALGFMSYKSLPKIRKKELYSVFNNQEAFDKLLLQVKKQKESGILSNTLLYNQPKLPSLESDIAEITNFKYAKFSHRRKLYHSQNYGIVTKNSM